MARGDPHVVDYVINYCSFKSTVNSWLDFVLKGIKNWHYYLLLNQNMIKNVEKKIQFDPSLVIL